MEELPLIREEYKILEKRTDSFLEGYRQNLAIIGSNSSSKTYLIEQFLKKKYSNSIILPLYIDLEYLSFSEFIRSIFTSLLFHFLKKEAKPAFYQLDSLILEAEKIIPQTTEKIKNILSMLTSKEKANFEWVIEVLNKVIDEVKIKILLIVDNFTILKNYPKKMLLEFTKYIITQKNIMFVFISKERKKAEELLSQELNLLFGSFEKIYIENLSYKEAESYINIKLKNRLPLSFKKFLIELTEGSPFYLDIITQDLLNEAQKEINLKLFIQKLSYLLINPKSCLYQIFNNKTVSIKHSFKDTSLIDPLLILIASGYTRKKDLLSLSKIDSKNLNNKLSKLQETNILNKNGSFYFIPDKLFSFWISSVFKSIIDLPLIFYEDRKEFIEKLLKEKFEEFNQAELKDSFQRFLDLVQLFKDDTVKTGKKSISLPQIKRFKIIPAHNKDMKFIIGEAKQYYLILAFKEDSPQDTDILEFSNRCSYFRHKQPKKIFITLKKAGSTAKLLAKEKRLFFWEKEDVNLLLRLYNRPLII